MLNATASSVQKCAATANGGGLSVLDGSLLLGERLEVRGCTAKLGGGVAAATMAVVQLQRSWLRDCAAEGKGGALAAREDSTIRLNSTWFTVSLSRTRWSVT